MTITTGGARQQRKVIAHQRPEGRRTGAKRDEHGGESEYEHERPPEQPRCRRKALIFGQGLKRGARQKAKVGRNERQDAGRQK